MLPEAPAALTAEDVLKLIRAELPGMLPEAPAALTAEDVLKLIRAELPGMLREALAEVLASAPGTIELALKDSGLPRTARDIALTLCQMAGSGMPSPSLSELAGMVGVDRRTVMRKLQVLEAAGWVRRLRADPDRARTEHVTMAYVVTIPATRGK